MPNKSIAAAPWQRLGTRVAFDQNTAADHTVVVASAGNRHRILAYRLTVVYVLGSGGIDEGVMPFQGYETAAGEALKLTLSGAVRVSGDVWYETY